jgi:proline-specific peptidase
MYITVNNARLFFDVDGAKLMPEGQTLREKPTLLLLHGGPGFDHSSFKPAFAQFTDIAQVVYLDHRGNGRSDRSRPEHWTLHQWADDVVGFCAALDIKCPIVLGHSFGGMVAIAYAIRHPNHPSKLILSSTSARHNRSRVLARFEQVGGPEAREVASRFWEDPGATTWSDYIEKGMSVYGPTRWSSDVFKRTRMNLEVLFHFARGEFRTFDLLEGMRAIRCPTLVLGGALDPICPIEDQEEIAQVLPSKLARFERFEQCGHGVYRDDPERGFQVIREFILNTPNSPCI